MGSEVHFDSTRPGAWQGLFVHAQALMDDMCAHIRPDAFWTFGGGTVLMLRHGHRLSKDIDLFVPDPQYLGFVNPRLSDFAADLCRDYVEAAEFIKLVRAEGEIDIVTGPNLTANAWTVETINGKPVRVETDVEIVAKKMWHRGDTAPRRVICLTWCWSFVAAQPRCALKAAGWYAIGMNFWRSWLVGATSFGRSSRLLMR